MTLIIKVRAYGFMINKKWHLFNFFLNLSKITSNANRNKKPDSSGL